MATKQVAAYVDYSSDEDSYDSEDNYTWIGNFTTKRGNEYFCQVEMEFVLDRFNLTGIGHDVPRAQAAYDLITDTSQEDGNDEALEKSARFLYGLIHARYILSPQGLSKMKQKFQEKEFGVCPRVFCQKQPVLPVGLSDIPGTKGVKLFCPKCKDVYHPKSSTHANVDGAFFGTTFAHLFLHTYAQFDVKDVVVSGGEGASVGGGKYVPKIFGFKLASKDRIASVQRAHSMLMSE